MQRVTAEPPDADVPQRAGGNLSALVADWIESGWAALDGEGRILEANESLRHWLAPGATALEGGCFWTLLAAREPTWEAALRTLREDPAVFGQVELSLPPAEGSPPAWYRLEAARAGAQRVVRLNSILPPRSELAEGGWAPQLAVPAAGPDLFIRWLRAENQLEQLARYWPGVIFSQRPDFSFQFVTGRVEELTGHSPEAWRTRRAGFWEVVHEADAAELQTQVSHAARVRESVTNTFRIRNAVTGRVNYVLEHRRALLSRSGLVLGYEGVWLDVTRQTLAEKLLTSAAWKETLAVLTMGLAHDFSNVMAGIHSLSESFLSQIEAGHAFHEGLGLIKKSSLQASQLVHRIVNLHLGKPGERSYHDLNQMVRDLLELVRKVIPRRIEIVAEFCPQPLPVYVDAFEFRQVLINLALNAADAMPERGRLVLRTERLTQLPAGQTLHGRPPRLPSACLTVQDNGSGIQAGHLQLIFDPFFTTKAGGKGSGLGLYNARLFVEKHQGGIAVESLPGHGASFHVFLPEADFTETTGTPAPSVSTTRRSLIVLGTAGTLLEATAELLRTEGFQVGTADTPGAATELLLGRDYIYEAVLVLVESPGGRLAPHVAGWLRARPRLKVIVRPVGRDRDEIEPELVGLAHVVLTPELSPASLLSKIRETLNR